MRVTDYTVNDIRIRRFLPDNEQTVSRLVVAVHGFGGDKDSTCIGVLAEKLCGSGGAVYTFDLPCHGESPLPDTALNTECCMEHLCTVVRHAKEQCPQAAGGIFATSFGGYTALIAMPRLEELLGENFPLVLRAPAVNPAKTFLWIVHMKTAEQFREKGTVRCRIGKRISISYSFYEDMIAHSCMHNIDHDGLLLYGSEDNIVLRDDIEDFCRRNPRISLHIAEGVDHRPHGEALDAMVSKAVQYLDSRFAQ
ncbi:MAG: alpha/beta hydrolase [Ruminococcaceae bacterium]|nr:alpha/beta hydrolase [Oscillospiraceae bacterium]